MDFECQDAKATTPISLGSQLDRTLTTRLLQPRRKWDKVNQDETAFGCGSVSYFLRRVRDRL